MATKSFLKNIVIKDKISATSFLQALENAEGKSSKKVDYNVSVKTIDEISTIKKIFNKG